MDGSNSPLSMRRRRIGEEYLRNENAIGMGEKVGGDGSGYSWFVAVTEFYY